MDSMFKDCIFGLYTTFHSRLGIGVLNFEHLACLLIDINSTLASTLGVLGTECFSLL